MSEMSDPTTKLYGNTSQPGFSLGKADHQQRRAYKGIQVFRSEGDEIALGKKAMVNLRANPAAMSRSMNFHETS